MWVGQRENGPWIIHTNIFFTNTYAYKLDNTYTRYYGIKVSTRKNERERERPNLIVEIYTHFTATRSCAHTFKQNKNPVLNNSTYTFWSTCVYRRKRECRSFAVCNIGALVIPYTEFRSKREPPEERPYDSLAFFVSFSLLYAYLISYSIYIYRVLSRMHAFTRGNLPSPFQFTVHSYSLDICTYIQWQCFSSSCPCSPVTRWISTKLNR